MAVSNVTIASDELSSQWTDFLEQEQVSHHAFSWKWRNIIERTFGHEPFYLISRDASKAIDGVLPLFFVKSMLFGRALVSVPYLNAGGISACSPDGARNISQKVSQLGETLDASYCELRHVLPCSFYAESAPLRTHKRTMHLKLPSNPEDLFASFRPKLRSQVRRPSKDGIYAQVSGMTIDEDKSLDAFYSVFAEHMRDLGTPVYPRELFSNTKRSFGEACRIITVWFGETPIAAGITLGFRDCVEIPWAAALKRYSRYAPNMLLYWEAMKTACTDGYRRFDFGRSSPDSGAYRFKEQWGAIPVTLHWYYQMFHGSVPDVNPQNPKYRALVRCWKKLPTPIANFIGPWLTRSIP